MRQGEQMLLQKIKTKGKQDYRETDNKVTYFVLLM